MKRYDHDGDGRLNFAELSRAFTPIELSYAQTLARRQPNVAKSIYKRDEVFLFETRNIFRNCLKTHVQVEQGVETLR